jgi:hypothetical protein
MKLHEEHTDIIDEENILFLKFQGWLGIRQSQCEPCGILRYDLALRE